MPLINIVMTVSFRLRERLRNRFMGAGASAGPDRKSTRLNSSHRTISYAAFCLKKKRAQAYALRAFAAAVGAGSGAARLARGGRGGQAGIVRRRAVGRPPWMWRVCGARVDYAAS